MSFIQKAVKELKELKKWLTTNMFKDIEKVDGDNVRFLLSLIDHHIIKISECFLQTKPKVVKFNPYKKFK